MSAPRPEGSAARTGSDGKWKVWDGSKWHTERERPSAPTPTDADPAFGGSGRKRSEINASDLDLPSVTNSAWQAIQAANDPPFLFRHGGRAVRIESNDDAAPLIRDLVESRVRHVLGRVATWVHFREVKGGIQKLNALPPLHVVKDILATPDMPLPILARIVQTPVFASDGTLQTAPGYHAASRTYHAPAKDFVLPEIADNPSSQDIARARSLIVNELLSDFPFVTDAERAHAVALMLHSFTRDLIDGPTPLHLFEAPSAGTGKGLLVNVLTCPATGQPASVMTEGRDDDEWRKRITSKLRTAPAFALIDNVQHRIDSAQLAAALTALVWEDRILGHSENAALPVRCAWIATGNNPALSTEIARRTVRIRLDAKQDRPFLRTGFRHPDLLHWVKANRAQLVWAALTLAKAWIVAGRPPFEGKALGTFESWSKTMGGIFAVAGIRGNLDDFYADSDAETSARRVFVEAWYERFNDGEVGAAQLWDVAFTLAEPLDLGEGSPQSQKIKLGNLVRQLRDRQFGNLKVTFAGERQNAQKWRLVEATK
jgi:putative DNA primase/helicase